MLRTAIVGLGWWGTTLVDAVANSDQMKMVAAFTRSNSDKDKAFTTERGLKLVNTYEALLNDPEIDAIILATQPKGHRDQVVGAAKAGKHVFCEKPFMMNRAEAVEAVKACEDAGVTLGLGYNRRFHPSWLDLKRRIKDGELGTILHMECTMSGPNGLSLSTDAWRYSPEEAPCGGLFPMGVHAIDGFIDLAGDVDQVFCQSLHRAVPGDNDDTTSVLFKMAGGMSAYLGVMTATSGSFRFQVYGSKGVAALGGMTHVVGQSSHQRRSGLFGSYVIKPLKGDAESIEVPEFDLNKAELEAFATAALGGPAYPITHADMIQAVAATEAIVASARTGQAVRV